MNSTGYLRIISHAINPGVEGAIDFVAVKKMVLRIRGNSYVPGGGRMSVLLHESLDIGENICGYHKNKPLI